MRKKLISIFVLSLVAATMLPSAHASNRTGAITIMPSVGYVNYSNKRDIKNGAMFMASLGYNASQIWSAEFTYGHTDTHSTEGTEPSVNVNMYLADALYHFDPNKDLDPYLIGGIGVLTIDDPNATENNTLANVNFGAGLEYFFAPSIALSAEIKDLFTLTGSKNDFIASIGVRFLLGGSTFNFNLFE